jgi:hypothetical protein
VAIHDPLTELIIGWFVRVANELGPGFLEKVYEKDLAHELRTQDLPTAETKGQGANTAARPPWRLFRWCRLRRR